MVLLPPRPARRLLRPSSNLTFWPYWLRTGFRTGWRQQQQQQLSANSSLTYRQRDKSRLTTFTDTTGSTPGCTPPTTSTLQSPPLTKISVTNDDVQEIAYIRRSYPNAKPEKLIAGLERLLASSSPRNYVTPTPTPTPEASANGTTGQNRHRWTLAETGDAIHRALILSDSSSWQELLRAAIDRASAELGHHPHVSFERDERWQREVCVITCTTHVPHGLSLKDVRLADLLNAVIEPFEDKHNPGRYASNVSVVNAQIIGRLIRKNEVAAECARTNSGSVCHLGKVG